MSYLDRYDLFWAGVLGCTLADLHGARTVVVPHGPALAGDCVVWAFHRLSACVVSVPPPMAHPLSPLAERHAPQEWFDRQFLLDVLRHPVRGVVGPVRLGISQLGMPERWHTLRADVATPAEFTTYAQYYAVRCKPTWP